MFIYTDYIKGRNEIRRAIHKLESTRRDARLGRGHWESYGFPWLAECQKGKTDEQYLTWLKSEIADSKEMLEKNLGIQISSGWPQVLVHKLTTAAANRAGLDVNMLDVRVLGANAFI
jgi:hypothetical protein